MQCSNNICHHPYTVPTMNSTDPYICRLAPHEDSIELEWFDRSTDEAYELRWSVRGEDDWKTQTVIPGTVRIENLLPDTEYELHVRTASGRSSRTRLARTGCIPAGTSVINYLHPEDEQYLFSGRFLCSPSLVKTPGGRLIAGMDVFGPSMGQNTTILFYSDDDGESWHYLCDLYPFYWSSLFYHRDAVYVLGLSTEYGNLQISRSDDEGKTWAPPTTIMYGANKLCAVGGISREPMQMTEYRGRLYTSIAYGSWSTGGHLPGVLSIAVDADPMLAENWTCSEFLPFEGRWKEESGVKGDAIEGNFVKAPDGCLYNYMRWKRGEMLRLRVDTEDPHAALSYDRIEQAPVSNSMFRILASGKKYYLITNRRSRTYNDYLRNVLSLYESTDLMDYTLIRDIVNFEDKDPRKFGFQYPAYVLDSSTLYISIRSAFNHADSFHNSNYILFCKTKL